MAWGSCYTPDFHVVSIIGAAGGTNAANDRRLVENMNGTPTFVIDAIDTGRYALRCTLTSEAQNILMPPIATTPRYSGGMCRFVVSSALGTQFDVIRVIASTTGESVKIRISAAGLIQYSFNDGGAYTSSGTTITAATTYRLEVFVDWGVSTTHTLKVQLNGAEIINTTGGTAGVTGTNILMGGFSTAAAMVIDVADMATYNDAAQYGTMPDWRVIGLEPTADGTHNFTDNDFQNAAASNITAANVAGLSTWDYVNDAPAAAPSTTDFVQQVVTRATSYMEWQLNSMPYGYGVPVLVCLAAAMHPVAAATANTVAFRLNSGGNLSTETAIDTSIASNTLEYRKHHYPTEPTTAAAWTTAMVQAPLRARFGYSSDAAPPPALDATMAFVLAPYASPPDVTAAHTRT